MRNVVAVSDRHHYLEGLHANEAVQKWCLDSEGGRLFFLTDCNLIHCCAQDTLQALWQVNIATGDDALGVTIETGCTFTVFSFVAELESLCLTASSGEIVLLHCGGDARALEEVGIVNSGILAGEWSPDGELLVLVTSGAQLLLMNMEWEVLAEVALCSESPAALKLSDVAISWRGDGKFFGIFAAQCNGDRAISVWEREGAELHATGEHVDTLEGVLAWQPNGRHLYAAQDLDGQLRVVLFERNGLQHGGFDLGTNGHIYGLLWSPDSELLAVAIDQPAAPSGTHRQLLQLWHRSNWNWYLKQEFCFDNEQSKLMMLWDDTCHARLHICTQSGWHRQVDLLQQPVVSMLGTAAVVDGGDVLLTPLRHAVVPPPLCAVTARFAAPVTCVAFLDGASVEKLAVLTSDHKVSVVESVEDDLWEETLDEHNADVSNDATTGAQALHGYTVPLGSFDGDSYVRHLVWLASDRLLAVTSCCDQRDASGDTIQELSTSGKGVVHTCPVDGNILRAVSVADAQQAAIFQITDGRLLRYSSSGHLSACSSNDSFPEACPWMCATPAAALNTLGDGTPVALGLSQKGHLYWGAMLIANEVTSAAVRADGPGGPHLLYTTRGSILHTRPFHQLQPHQPPDAAPLANGHAPLPRNRGLGAGKHANHYTAMHAAMRPTPSVVDGKDISMRAVEQGATLLAAPPGGVRVVLQMPRGNLETVCPRALVLAAIAERLQQQDYAAAWELACNNRVDLNVLVDYNWPEFVGRAAEFVAAVPGDAEHADLLMALRPDSVTAQGGAYATLPRPPSPPQGQALAAAPLEDKVGLVCRAMVAALSQADSRRYLKAILSSHAKLGELERALALIKQVKEEDLAGHDLQGESAGPQAEDGLKHLLLTIDVEKLYRAALGMYELELAYMVISHAQRDPGEYMLELQGFASVQDPALRRHAIDMHLHRFSSALRTLVAAGDSHFEASLSLAQDKGLLRELLSLVESNPGQRTAVLRAQAQVLRLRNMNEDAGLAFVAAGDLAAALQAYQAAGEWRMVLALAGRLGWSQEQVQRVAEGLAEELAGMGRPADAAAVAVEYLADADNAVLLYSQAREWREALRIAYKYEREDLVETVVAPAGAEAAASVLEELRDNTARVTKYLTRLREVQQRRENMQAALEADEDADAAPLAEDEMSEAGSTVSGMSAYTTASTAAASTVASTGRPASTVGGRKPQRRRKGKADKGPRIRQGSPQEEAALVQHLASLAPSARQCAEVGQLLELLVLLGHVGDARLLQHQLSLLMREQQAAAAYVAANPLSENRKAAGQQTEAAVTLQATDARWKWDVLRQLQ